MTGRLERNIAALAAYNPAAALAAQRAEPHPDAHFGVADDGAVWAGLGPVALCSRREPLAEAGRFARGFEPARCAMAVVLGFGAGHGVAECQNRMRSEGVVLVYEPDAALLRAVLGAIDHTPSPRPPAWMAHPGLAVVTEPDAYSIGSAFNRYHHSKGLNIAVLASPGAVDRIGAGAVEAFLGAMEAVRQTHAVEVLTAIKLTPTTLQNSIANAAVYAGQRA